MLFTFLNIDPVTELKLRKAKASKEKFSKRALKVLAENRVERYENSKSIEDVVAELLEECVIAVSKQRPRRVVKAPRRIEKRKSRYAYRRLVESAKALG